MKHQEQNPKQAAAGLAAVAVMMIAGCVVAWMSSKQSIKDYFEGNLGPTELTSDQLVTLTSPHQVRHCWARFKPSQAVETGLQLTRGRVTHTAVARFVLLKVNDNHIVAKVPLGPVRTPTEGQLTVWSTALSPEVEAMMEIRKKFPNARLLPFQLDCYEAPLRNNAGAMIAIMAFLGGFGFILLPIAAWMLFTAKEAPKPAPAVADPFSHPVWQFKR